MVTSLGERIFARGQIGTSLPGWMLVGMQKCKALP